MPDGELGKRILWWIGAWHCRRGGEESPTLENREALSSGAECVCDPFHLFAHLAERFPNYPSLENWNVAKRYIEGKLYILVFFKIAGFAKDYLATFRYGKVPHERDFQFASVWRQPEGFYRGFVKTVVNSAEGLNVSQQQVVLIGDVEPMKPEDRIAVSEVRLYEPQSLLVNRSHAFYFRPSIFVQESGLGCADREAGTQAGSLVVRSYESCGDVIQGATQIVDRITNDEADGRPDCIDILDYIISVAGLHVVAGANFARVSIKEAGPLPLEFINVGVGALDLEVGRREVSHGQTG